MPSSNQDPYSGGTCFSLPFPEPMLPSPKRNPIRFFREDDLLQVAGPKDVIIDDESSTAVLVIWECLGGHTSVGESMRWSYAVRPCHFGLMVLRKVSGLPIAVERRLAPLARAFDALTACIL